MYAKISLLNFTADKDISHCLQRIITCNSHRGLGIESLPTAVVHFIIGSDWISQAVTDSDCYQ